MTGLRIMYTEILSANFHDPNVFILLLNLDSNTELNVDVKHCFNLSVNMIANI